MAQTRFSRTLLLSTSALVAAAALPAAAAAQPAPNTVPVETGIPADVNGAVIGAPAIDPGTGRNTLPVVVVNQRAVINWASFSIGSNGEVRFTNPAPGPNPDRAVLNRDLTGAMSQIYGFLTADPNISVFLLNPNGVLFGPSATVNVGGLVASNLAISDPDFLDGDPNFTFAGAGGSLVRTLGGAAINAGPGAIAFLGSQVDIAAGSTLTSSGDVALVAVHDVTLSLNPGSPLAMTINQGTAVQNAMVVGGAVEGRNIYLAVATRGSITNALLNVSGTLEATGATATDRGVVLTGGRSGSGVTVATGGGNDTSGDVSIAVNGSVTSAADIELRASRDVTINSALVAPAAEQINISAGAAAGTVLYNGAAQLTADTTIDAANVRFTGTVDSASGADLNITASASTRFDQAVGGGATLGSVTVGGAGTTTISGGAVRTSGGQSYGAVNLVGDTELSSTGNGDIALNGAVNSLSGLTVNTGGDTRFGGITSVRSLATGLGGTTTIAGGTVLTTNTQSYGDDVVLTADTAITSTGAGAAGNVTFGGTVNGAHVLTVETAGTTRFNGAVGGVTALRELNTVGGGSAIISGGSVRTSERQTYNNTLIFGANATLTSTGAGAAGNIWFLGPVGGVGADVTVNTAGETRFASTASLASLTTDMAGSTRIAGGSILTSGNQSYGDPVQIDAATALTGANLTFDGAVNGNHLLVTNSPGITRFNGAVTVASLNTASGLADPSLGVVQIAGGGVTTTGAQIYANDVVLAAATLLNSTGGGDINFNDFVDGAFALTVTTAGTTTFFGRVGATNALASLTVNGGGATRLAGLSVNTTANQVYTDDLLLIGNLTLAGDTPTFGGDVTGDGSNLTLNFTGETRISGTGDPDPTDFTNIGVLQTGGGGLTVLSGVIATSGSQTYLDDLRLAAETTLRGTSGVFTNLDGNGQNLVLEFAGTVALTPAVINVANLTSRNGGTTTITDALTTTGSQTFDDNLVLLGDTVLTSSGNGDILLSRITGAFDLTVNTGGVTRLTGVIGGGGGSLDMLTTDAGGTTLITGGAITTSGAQAYGDNVQLGADTFIASGAGNITFAGTVSSSGGDRVLSIDSQGDISFNGAVGTLAALNVTAGGGTGGSVIVAGGSVTTSGGQSYAQRVVLNQDAVLTSTASGAIAFGGVVNGPRGLTVNTAGVTSFFQSVGTPGAALAFLRTDAPGETQISGIGVTTIGNQDYLDTLRLLAPSVALRGATPTFGGRVIGNGTALTLTFTGDTSIVGTLPGDIANFTGLTSLTTDGGGRTILSGLLNIADQSYFDMVTLAGDTRLVGVNPLFGGNVDGDGFDLTLDFSGTTILSGTGDVNPVDFIDIDALSVGNGGTLELSGTIATTGPQTYGDVVTLVGPATLQSSGAGAAGAIGFTGTVDGVFALTVTTAGITTFGGAVGGNSALAALSVNGGGATHVNGGRVLTTGNQSYSGLLSLGADTLLAGATPTFGGNVVGNGHDLTLRFSGNTRITAAFTGIDDLVSDGGGRTFLSGSISTTGSQDYGDAVLLAGATTLTSTGDGAIAGDADISFRSTVDSDGAAQPLTVNTAGVTRFGGRVGAAAQLAGLATDAPGSTELSFDINARSTTIGDPLLLIGSSLQRIVGGAVTLAQVTGTPNNLGIVVNTGRPGGFDAAIFNGVINVANLGVRAETVAFNAFDNDVNVLAVSTNSGGFTFRDSDDLIVGAVDAIVGITTPGAASNLLLVAGGPLTISNMVNVGGTISLTALGITSTAAIRAGLDGSSGAILIDANDRGMDLGAALTTTDTGASAIRLIDATNVSLADVSTGAGGTLTLGVAGNDRITSNVSQLAGTSINVGILTGAVDGSVLLANTNNLVGALSAFGAANLSLRDNAGGLVITGDVNVPGQLSLSVNGTLNQTGGTVIAGDLFATTAGGTSLERPGNRIANVSGLTNAGGGGIRLNNAIALRIRDSILGNIIIDAGTGALQIDAPGITFTDEVLRAGANLTLVGQAGAVMGDALRAGGNVTVNGATIDVNSAVGATGGDSRAALITMTATNGGLRLGVGRSVSDIILSAASLPPGLDTASITGTTWVAGGRIDARGEDGVAIGDASATGGAASVNTILLRSATGGVTLGTGIATGNVTLDAATLASATRIQSGGTIEVDGNAVNIGTAVGLAGDGSNALLLDLNARVGGLTLGTGRAGVVTLVKTGAGVLQVSNSLTAGTNATITSGGEVRLATTSVGGNLIVDAAQLAAFGRTTGLDIRVLANDVDLADAMTATTILLTNRPGGGSGSGNPTVLGDVTAFAGAPDRTGAFTLTQAEVNRLGAPTVTIQSGTQNVEIGAVNLGANVGSTNLRLLGTARFDVTGAVQGNVARTLQIGGDEAVMPTAAGAMADRIVIRPTVGGGGRILLSAGRLDLRGQRIAAGLDPSADTTPQQNLLNEIGILTGSPDATSSVAAEFVSSPNSSLYFEQTLIGTGDAAVFLRADRLVVTYSEYALFQNTAFQNGLSAGVVLDSRTAGGLALDINTTGRDALNAFALFGSINDARASAAAVLGATVIDASNVNPANSRINGCLISSAGGGCLITAINPPPIEAVREDLINIITADEAALQVDPLVGTSNEALLTDCESDPGAEQCPAEERP